MTSTMRSLRWFAALALCAWLAPSQLLAAPMYTASFLPGADFIPEAMNNAGQIAGSVNTPDGSHAVLYSGGVLRDLGFGAGTSSDAVAINGSGAVAGTAVLNGVAHGFLYQNGALADIGANTSGSGINGRGDVVGSSYTDAGSFGFVYSGGIFTQLPNLGTGRMGVAVDINDQGAIAGWSVTNYDSSPPPLHPYLYRDGTLRDLGGLGDSFETQAAAINNAGQIAGSGKVVDDDHAFLYENGVMKDLGFFGGGNLGVVDLNEQGTLIGNASAANGAPIAFVSIGDALVDLNTLLDPALGWSVSYAYANNDLGQIVGFGCQGDACGVVRLDLTSAVPEPAATWLLVPGLLMLAAARRWRRCRERPRALPRRCLALALLPALLAPLHGQAAVLYTVQQLPQEFNPSDINNAGQMAGALYSAEGLHAAVYDSGVMRDLGTFGGAYGYANAINDAGAVTGNFGGAGGAEHAFLYRDGSMADIGALSAVGINASGDVVGQQRGNGATGVLYSHGTLTELGHLGDGNVSLASAINDAGQIVGESNLAGDSQEPTHPYLFDGGALTDLGTLAGRGVNSAVAINNAGQVAGYSDAGNGRMHVFFYEHGVMTDLGSFGGLDVTIGGMNQQGQVVGTANTADGPDVPFISTAGGLVDLNTLIDPALGWRMTSALDINDHGQIIGYACRGGQCSAVLLEGISAVPEPDAVLLLIAGCALLGARANGRRKKAAGPCGNGGFATLQR